MSTHTALLVVTLTIPLSGCATFGVYDWMAKGLERHANAGKQLEVAPETQQPAKAEPAPATKAEPSLADQQAAAKAQQQQREIESAKAFIDWLKTNETYVRELCAKPAGSELHIDAFENMKFAVSSDQQRYSEAQSRGYRYRVATCPSSDEQSVEDANPLSFILAQTIERGPAPLSPSEEYNQRVLEKHRQLKLFDEEAKRQREQRIAKLNERIDRFMNWFFDAASILFLYGAFNDGKY